jgi:hypothetical protein
LITLSAWSLSSLWTGLWFEAWNHAQKSIQQAGRAVAEGDEEEGLEEMMGLEGRLLKEVKVK